MYNLYLSIHPSIHPSIYHIYLSIYIYYQRLPRIHIVSPGSTDSQLTQQTPTNVALGDDTTWFLWVDHPKPFGPFGPSRSLNFLLFFFSNCSYHGTVVPRVPSAFIYWSARADLRIFQSRVHMWLSSTCYLQPFLISFGSGRPITRGANLSITIRSPCPSCTIPADLQQSLSNVSYGLLTHFYRLKNWKHPTSTSISSPFLLRQFIL